MKKSAWMIILLGGLCFMTACQAKDAGSTTDETTQTTATAEEEKTTSVFQAVLTEAPTVSEMEDGETIRLVLKDVTAVADSENILPMMKDGVVLNVTKEKMGLRNI